LARAYLIPLDAFNGDEALIAQRRTFQYFPSTISDSQATSYQAKVIPGLSHPLYQWTAGGARTISFEAVFTRDRTYTRDERKGIEDGQNKARFDYDLGGSKNFYGFGIAKNDDPRNVDIPSAVAWLRSFLLPDYSSDGKGKRSGVPMRPRPPNKMILGLPGVRANWGVPTLNEDEVNTIMTGCEVVYTGFFHDGTPRIARVALAFAEIIQVGGAILPHDSGDKRRVAFGGYELNDDKDRDRSK